MDSVRVDTLSDISDGNTVSINALLASPGADGRISLREAIIAANNSAGSNTIDFNVNGTISVSSQLPALNDASGGTIIRGAGAITLSGRNLTGKGEKANESGLVISAAENVIEGLTIVEFPLNGLLIQGITAHDNSVINCRIGTDGTNARGNGVHGIHITGGAYDNVIGGLTANQRNIVSGNGVHGIMLSGSGVSGNRIIGNYIGLDATGANDLGNGQDGVAVYAGASTNIVGGAAAGSRNYIAGNNFAGVEIAQAGSDRNSIQGNYIGVNISAAGVPNTSHGIKISQGASNNVVGGTVSGTPNLISRNGGNGVVISDATSVGNSLRRNSIHHNGGTGISLQNGANSGIAKGAINQLRPTIAGAAPANVILEFFADQENEGQTYVASGLAGADGTFGAAVDLSSYAGANLTVVCIDSGGNTSEFSAPFLIDLTAPVITLNGAAALTVECGSVFADPGAVANDTAAGDLSTRMVVTGSVNTAVTGTYALRYNVSDPAGNAAAEVTRTVEVSDTQAPVVTLVGENTITVECHGTFTDPGATAQDTCEGDVSGNLEVVGYVDVDTPGLYPLQYRAKDSLLHMSAEVTRTVRVVDTGKPTIALIGSATATVECKGSYSDPGVTAEDVCDGNLDGAVQTTGTVNTEVPGVYTLRYNVRDSAGNTATEVTRTVTVRDSAAPAITRLGDATVLVECHTAYTDAGATAADACAGDLTGQIQVSGTVDVNTPGTYTLRYDVQDVSGNAAVQRTRSVIVRDSTNPQITLTGNADMAIECGSVFTEPGVTAADACSGDLTSQIVFTGSVNPQNPGTYTLRYSVQDAAGRTAQATRAVTVADTTAPVVSLTGSSTVTIACGTIYVDAGATAVDACDGALAASTEDTVDSYVPGDHILHFTAEDQAGNVGAANRVVHVSACAEGEGDTEGEDTLARCVLQCVGTPRVDNDGDGLSACVEACLDFSDDAADSDGNGIPDNVEARNLDNLDARLFCGDPDHDSLTNLEEYLLNSGPLNPNDPGRSYYVSPQGEDVEAAGTLTRPWATINYALSRFMPPSPAQAPPLSPPSAASPVRLILMPGVYREDIQMLPYQSLVGQIEPCTPAPEVPAVKIQGWITGANPSALHNLEIEAVGDADVLLDIEDVVMKVVDVTFRGTALRAATGILIDDGTPRRSVIERCTFTSLAIGIDIWGAIPRVRRCLFEDISQAAILVRANPEIPLHPVGNQEDPETGWNIFKNTVNPGGPAVINQRAGLELLMQKCDWDTNNPEEIANRVEGSVDTTAYLAAGSGILAASLYCTVWNAANQNPILNASVQLTPSNFFEITDNVGGVYAFPAIPSGAYTVVVTAPGYEENSQTAQVGSGQTTSVVVALWAEGPAEGGEEGEGVEEGSVEGGGEGEGEDDCGCNKNKLGSMPGYGDLFLAGLGLITLLVSSALYRREE